MANSDQIEMRCNKIDSNIYFLHMVIQAKTSEAVK